MSLQIIQKRLEESKSLQATLGVKLNKYAANVMAEIIKTRGDAKGGDLTLCTPGSIVSAVKKACDLQLEIDGRQHCHLIKYKNEANLQVGYRGLIYSIKRAFPDANIDCQLVYEGDEFKLIKEGDSTMYNLVRNNPFADDSKIIGGFCYISYTLGGRLRSFCETMSLSEINKIKGCAKQQFIWNKWFAEKAKVAIIKRACKIHFAGINQDLDEVIDYDNKEYDLESKVVEPIEKELIDSEKAFELQELIKKSGKDEKDICSIYQIESIIQLPLDKYEVLKGALCK